MTITVNPFQQLLKLEQEANDFGFTWPNQQMIIEQLIDECREIREALAQQESRDRIQEEMGDLLHAAISLCDFIGFDIAETLEKVCAKFNKRLQAIKQLTQQTGLNNLHGQRFEYMLTLWKEAKILTERDKM